MNKCPDPIWFWNFHYRSIKSRRKVLNVMFWCCSLIVREQGFLYALSCVLPDTDKKSLTDKMKPNQFLHQLELLSSIQLQGLWVVKTYCDNKHIPENITYTKLCMIFYIPSLENDSNKVYSHLILWHFLLLLCKSSHGRWVFNSIDPVCSLMQYIKIHVFVK